MHVDECRIIQAQFFGAGVHHFYERLRASGNMFRHSRRSVISGVHGNRFQ